MQNIKYQERCKYKNIENKNIEKGNDKEYKLLIAHIISWWVACK